MLFRSYHAIRATYPTTSMPPPLPARTRNPHYSAYRRSYKDILKNVSPDRTHSVYLWYAIYPNNSVEYIYVGETSEDKEGLRGRLKYHFFRLHHSFWATIFRTDKYLIEALRLYTNRENYKPKDDYVSSICNNWLKCGATHIAYCSEIPQEFDIKTIEADLIQLFENPRGNVKGIRAVPFLPDRLLPISNEIYSGLRKIAQSTKSYSF